MNIKRFFGYFFALLLLILLGAGLYGYYNLSAIITGQVQHYLKAYGVDDIHYDTLQVSDDQFHIDSLWLRGDHEGLEFETTLTALTIHYDWRALLSGQVQSVAIDTLDIAINNTTPATEPDAEPAVVNLEGFIPQNLIGSLPVQSLRIPNWNLDYSAPGLPDIHASGELLLNENLEFALTASSLDSDLTARVQTKEESPLLEVALTLCDKDTEIVNGSALLRSANDEHWNWELQGHWQYTPLLKWLQRIDAQTEVPLDITTLEDVTLQGDSRFNATVTHPTELSLAFDPGIPEFNQLQANIELSTEIKNLRYADTITGLTGTLKTRVELDSGILELNLETAQLEGVLNNTVSQFSLQPLQLKTRFAVNDPLQLDTRINTSVALHLEQTMLPQIKLGLHQQGPLEESKLELHLTDLANSITADVSGTMNLTTGAGNLSLHVQSEDLPALAREVNPLLQHFGLRKQNVSLSAGSFKLQTDLQSTEFDLASWSQKSQLSVKEVSGTFDEMNFEGIALSAMWTGIEQWKTVQPIKLSMQHLFIGFDIHNLQAQFSMPRATPIKQPELTLESFSTELFGGTLSLAKTRPWSFGAQSNSLTLLADQWQLTQLVALQSDKDIQAEGTLEGKLPVTLIDGRVTIDKGYLRALPPGGTIRYLANDSSRALASSNPELKLALDLLSDFHYQILKSGVELDQAGNLILGLSLAGSNPSQYQGQPINFNINLEQNIDPLLQSLRLSDKLIEQIEDGLK